MQTPTRSLATLITATALVLPSLRAQQPLVAQPAPAAVLAAFDVMRGTTQNLQVPASAGATFSLDVILAGRVYQVDFRSHEVRAAGFQLLVEDAVGIHQVPTPPSVTYRGDVRGERDSAAAGMLGSDGLTASILFDGPDRGIWGIQPTGTPGQYLVYNSNDNSNDNYRCGVPDGVKPVDGGPAVGGTDTIMVAEIACDADFQFYQQNGSNVTNTQNDVTGVVNAMSVIYRRDVDIDYQITTILVRSSSASNPYTTNDPSSLLSQFASRWIGAHGGIQRDLAHLFTGRNLTGSTIGIASLGSVCNRNSAYGLSQSRFSSNSTRRMALTAHETGHNWNATHCNGTSGCRIMCSSLGGCGTPSSFGTQATSRISSFRNSRSCLVPRVVTPAITVVNPFSVRAFQPPLVTLFGSGFDGTTSVQVGTATLTSFVVVNDTQLQFVPPPPIAVGTVPVSVTNPAGTSNSVNLTYTETRPPILVGPVAAVGGFPASFRFGLVPSEHWYLLLSIAPTTTPIQGANVLSSFAILSIGSADLAGLGSYTTQVPAGILNGLTLYAQVLDIDPSTLTLTGTSSVESFSIFN